MSANPRNVQAAKEQFASLADQLIDAGWMLRDALPESSPINARIVALEDSLLQFEESVTALWRAISNAEMPSPNAVTARHRRDARVIESLCSCLQVKPMTRHDDRATKLKAPSGPSMRRGSVKPPKRRSAVKLPDGSQVVLAEKSRGSSNEYPIR